jgi:hypothetical protein
MVEIDTGNTDLMGFLEIENDRGDEDQRPAQAYEQSQGAGEVGCHKADVGNGRMLPGIPGYESLHGEFRQGLDEGQDRQGESLGDEELCGFCAPGYNQGGQDHRRESP